MAFILTLKMLFTLKMSEQQVTAELFLSAVAVTFFDRTLSVGIWFYAPQSAWNL